MGLDAKLNNEIFYFIQMHNKIYREDLISAFYFKGFSLNSINSSLARLRRDGVIKIIITEDSHNPKYYI